MATHWVRSSAPMRRGAAPYADGCSLFEVPVADGARAVTTAEQEGTTLFLFSPNDHGVTRTAHTAYNRHNSVNHASQPPRGFMRMAVPRASFNMSYIHTTSLFLHDV